MADQIATRYGVLGREVSHVVLETIALTARDGVNALDDVRRRLGLLSTLDRPSPIDPPGRRWTDLLRSLFPVGNLLVDSWGPPSLELLEVPTTEADERTIRKLLTAAASFVLAESTALDSDVELWEQLTGKELDEVQQLLQVASGASSTLLDHAEAGTWRALLATHARASAPALPLSARSHVHVMEGQGRVAALPPQVLQPVDVPQQRRAAGPHQERVVVLVADHVAVNLNAYLSVIVRTIREAAGHACARNGAVTEVIVQTPEHRDLLTRAFDVDCIWDPRPRIVLAPRAEAGSPATESSQDPVQARRVSDVLTAMAAAVADHHPHTMLVIGADLPGSGRHTSVVERVAQELLTELSDHKPGDPLPDLIECFPDLHGCSVVFAGLTSAHARNFWHAVTVAVGAASFEAAERIPHSAPQGPSLPDRSSALLEILNDWGRTLRAVLVVGALAAAGACILLPLTIVSLHGHFWVLPALGALAMIGFLVAVRRRWPPRTKPRHAASTRAKPAADADHASHSFNTAVLSPIGYHHPWLS